MGNNVFDDLKKRAREDAYADIRQWMFWLPLTPNELTILGAIYAVQIENGDWGDEFALMEERWCSGFPYFRECLAKLLGSSMELILSSQSMGTRGGGTSGSWFPGEPETPQKRHGKGCGGTPFSMPFLLSH